MKSDKYQIRNFQISDSEAVNRVALAAFAQYENYYDDWHDFANKIANMAALANSGEIIIASVNEKVIAAVCYVPAGNANSLFSPEWAVIRMLVVDPEYRGLGIGKALTEECIQRAIGDNASIIALHTSPIMKVALDMYLRLGFKLNRQVNPINGVPYSIYTKQLSDCYNCAI